MSLELDSELSEFEGVLLRHHLAACDRCAERARAFEAMTAVVRSTPLETPSATFRQPARASRAGTGLRVAAAAAAALVVAAVPLGVHLRKADVFPPRVPAANMASTDLVHLRAIRRAQLRVPSAALHNVRARALFG
jgi:hypothetical protein